MKQIVSLFLLAGAVAAPAAAQQGLASQLPAETAIYFEIPDLNAFSQGFSSSALGRIWNDQPTQEFLAPVMPMIEGGLMQAKAGLEAQGIPSALLDPASYGRIEVGIAIAGFDPTMGPDMQIGARLGFHDAALAQACFGIVGGLMSAQGAEMTENLITFDDGVGTVKVSLDGSTLTLDARKGMIGGGGDLASSENFQASRQALPQGQMFLHMNMAELVGLMHGVVEANGPDEMKAMIPLLLGSIGLDSIGTMSFTTGWKAGKSFGEGVITFGPEGPTGLIGASNSGGAIDKSLAEYIPSSANAFTIGNANFSAVWSFLTHTADQFVTMFEESGQPIDRSAPEFAWLYGEQRAVYDKAFAAIGPEAFSWAKNEVSLGSSGSGATYIRVRDVEAVRNMLTQVMPQLQMAMDGFDLVSLSVKPATDRTKDAEGNWTTVTLGEYYQFSFNLNALPLPNEARAQIGMMASMLPKPAFGVTDDGWMVFSANGPSAIRKAMKNKVMKPDENILANAEAADFLSRVPASADALAWSDPRPVVAGAVTMAQSMLPMALAQIPGGLPVDFDLMPTPDQITRHLRTSESYSWLDGKNARVSSVGSMNAGDLIVLAGMGGGLAAGLAVSAQQSAHQEMFEEAQPIHTEGEGSAAGETANGLTRLGSGLAVYYAINGSYPSSLEQLLVPQEDWEDGFLSNPEMGVGVNGWGNAYLYTASADGFSLYSCGPNGVDDGGAGDDIKVE